VSTARDTPAAITVTAEVPGREPPASAVTDPAARTAATTASATATMTAACRSRAADPPGWRRSARNRQISVADPVTSARTPSPAAKTPRL